MSFKSAVGSTYASFSIVEDQVADVAGKTTGQTETLTITAPPAGKYLLSASMYVTAQLTGVFTDIEVAGTIGATALNIEKITIGAGAGLKEYRCSGSIVVDCNGVDDIDMNVTCDISADTWTFKEGSFIEIIRVV